MGDFRWKSGERRPATSDLRRARVSGLSLYEAPPPGEPYDGTIEVELRADSVYYIVRLQRIDGSLLLQLSFPVSRRVMAKSEDPYECALMHAIEAIRRYRIRRTRTFTVERWDWDGSSA